MTPIAPRSELSDTTDWMSGGQVIQDPFSEEYFWFDESEWNSDPLESWDAHTLDSARDNWGWDEWGDLCVFRPHGYEPAYRYPLLVWLTLEETPDQALRDWFPDMSDRNYVAVGVRIRRTDSVARNADQVVTSIREVAALYGIHPSRVWIAGQDAAADWALRLLPSVSKLVQGVIAITPKALDPVEQHASQTLRGKQLFLVTEDNDEADLAMSLVEYWEMSEGQGQCLAVESLSTARLAICRELNEWLMRQVCTPARS
jgi:hypothetical protein